MRKMLVGLLVLGAMLSFSHAEMNKATGMKQGKKMMKMFQAVPKGKATLLQEGNAKGFCPECGMTLTMFFKTNHTAQVEGKTKQYCSIHCLVEDMQKGSKLDDIKVVDTKSLKFIDATKATYVVGSSKKGTMTAVSKYAFENKADAQAFAKANGGEIMGFDAVLKTAKEGFANESKMISKKQEMMAQKGEMIYGKMCQKTDEEFTTTAAAKAFVVSNKLCNGLNGKQLQAVGLYLKNR